MIRKFSTIQIDFAAGECGHYHEMFNLYENIESFMIFKSSSLWIIRKKNFDAGAWKLWINVKAIFVF